jgi:hypothetical protein
MNGKGLMERRALFFALWILLFGSFYIAHWGLTWDRSPVVGTSAALLAFVFWLGQWVWIAVYRKMEPKLARLSAIFLVLFVLMVIWDGPITE